MKDPNSSKQRLVNVHQAKTHLSRLMDEAHTGETIVLAKAGRPWARLMPLEPTPEQRIPGRLSAFGLLKHPDALLEPLSLEELASWEESSLPQAPSQS
jgi:prevent-host-death family protein